MLIRFTKTTPTRHKFGIVRDDPSAILRAGGSNEEAEFETRSLMPHDLIHLAYESTAGLRESFYGKLASGTTFKEFGDRTIMSDPANTDTELIMTERIVGPLTGYLEKDVSEERFMEGLRNMFDATGTRIPEFITPAFLQNVKERYRALIGQWRTLPHHTAMEVIWE